MPIAIRLYTRATFRLQQPVKCFHELLQGLRLWLRWYLRNNHDLAERVSRCLARSCFFYALGNPCQQSTLGVQLEGEGALDKKAKQKAKEMCTVVVPDVRQGKLASRNSCSFANAGWMLLTSRVAQLLVSMVNSEM